MAETLRIWLTKMSPNNANNGNTASKKYRQEIVSIELTVTASHFNCKMWKPFHQSSAAFKFIKSNFLQF